MNKAAKAFLLTAVCCLLGGIIMVTTCAAIANVGDYSFSLNGYRSGSDIERTYQNTGAQSVTLDSLSTLRLEMIAEPVNIRYGGDEIKLEWTQSYDQQYKLSDNSGYVSLRRDDGIISGGFVVLRDGRLNLNGFLSLLNGELWWNKSSIDDTGYDRAVTLTLPEGTRLSNLEIVCVSSRITIDDLSAGSITVNAVEATISINNSSIDSLKMDNMSGRADIVDTTLERLEVDTMSSRISLRGGRAEHINLDGLDAHLKIDGTEGLKRVSMDGLNINATLRLPGETDGYSFEADGLHAQLRLNGKSYRGESRIGHGDTLISVSGLNAVLDVTVEE